MSSLQRMCRLQGPCSEPIPSGIRLYFEQLCHFVINICHCISRQGIFFRKRDKKIRIVGAWSHVASDRITIPLSSRKPEPHNTMKSFFTVVEVNSKINNQMHLNMLKLSTQRWRELGEPRLTPQCAVLLWREASVHAPAKYHSLLLTVPPYSTWCKQNKC